MITEKSSIKLRKRKELRVKRREFREICELTVKEISGFISIGLFILGVGILTKLFIKEVGGVGVFFIVMGCI